MLRKLSKLSKRIVYTVLSLFLIFNIIAINQAYHLTHFYNHNSVKPIAEQTNGFWGLIRTAIFGVKLEKLTGPKPDSPYTNVKLKTKEGLVLDCWLIHVPHPKGSIAIFHGHGSEKSANLSQSNFFNEQGYSTLLIDFRAHGQSEGNTCTIGYKEAEDVKLAYDYLENHGEKNILLYGISLGAATITKAVADYSLAPKKIILEMPFASLPATVEGKVRMAGPFAKPVACLLTFWGGCINGFWAFDMKPKEFVKKIKCPVLLQWGEKDPGVTKIEINEIYNNIPSPKKLVVYEKSGHQNLYENEPDKWEDSVGEFLNE